MTPPLRVLQLLAPARAGGLESVVTQLSAGLKTRGHAVRVAAVLAPDEAAEDPEDHPFLAGVRAAGVPVDVLAIGGRDYRAERRAVADLLQRHDIQVLHTHGYRPDVVDGPVARQLGRAHVTTLHGFIGSSWRNRLYEWLQVRAARRADAAIAVSAPIADRLNARAGRGRVVLLRNAVSPARDPLSRDAARHLLGLPSAAFVVGWVGRVSYEKGPDLFVEALAHTDGSVHGAMVGAGPMLAAVRDLAAERGISHRLHLPGLQQGAGRLMAAFDVLALTSRTEGTPMVLLEAMWAGLPIVATAVGGVPDVVSAGEASLCPSGGSKEFAAAIQALAADPARARTLAAIAAARVARDFDPARWISSMVDIYCRAIR